ncbi:hypothetical protein IGS68_24130 [Skermanella sp. TT6]|uniref:Uncharacterized protein n=1 Tax=Skermanella cutis TaxID=2775420 RepID=A0ABX7B7H7_9PROT|nr:hypothetical protein [Skermanella sp. TT6]QQP89056.1 hypothetical protein IGS68_24130 [Skermanella sp. TT6]
MHVNIDIPVRDTLPDALERDEGGGMTVPVVDKPGSRDFALIDNGMEPWDPDQAERDECIRVMELNATSQNSNENAGVAVDSIVEVTRRVAAGNLTVADKINSLLD